MTLLLLAGTAEAQQIAEGLARREARAVASFAGTTREPPISGLPTRTGGFGGDAGFAAYLKAHGITAVLDATHPFACRISARTARICARRGLSYAQVLRPPWKPREGDQWVQITAEEEAAGHIPPGAKVFLATGRQTLERFANLSDRRLICRQIDPPEETFPFPNGGFLVGSPPFSVEDEVALFTGLGVDWLVVKNAGGDASRAKLDAARILGLPVAMIARPPQPDRVTRVSTVPEALAWVDAL